MIEKQVKVINHFGIHCRPSAIIVRRLSDFPDHKLSIVINNNAFEIDGLISLIALGIEQNAVITVQISGPDEVNACNAVAELFTKEFEFTK